MAIDRQARFLDICPPFKIVSEKLFQADRFGTYRFNFHRENASFGQSGFDQLRVHTIVEAGYPARNISVEWCSSHRVLDQLFDFVSDTFCVSISYRTESNVSTFSVSIIELDSASSVFLSNQRCHVVSFLCA